MESTLIEANVTFKKIDSRYVGCYNMHAHGQDSPEAPAYWLGCIPELGKEQEEFSLWFLEDLSGSIAQDSYFCPNIRKNKVDLTPVAYYDHHGVLPLLKSLSKEEPAPFFYLFKERLQKNGEQTVHVLLPSDEKRKPGISLDNPSFGDWIQETVRNHKEFLVLHNPAYPEDYFKQLYPTASRSSDSVTPPEHYYLFNPRKKIA